MSASSKNYWVYDRQEKEFLLMHKTALDNPNLPTEEYSLAKIPLVAGLRFIQEFGQMNGHIPRVFHPTIYQQLIQAASMDYLRMGDNRLAIERVFDRNPIFQNHHLKIKAIMETLGNFDETEGTETLEDYSDWCDILINVYQGGI